MRRSVLWSLTGAAALLLAGQGGLEQTANALPPTGTLSVVWDESTYSSHFPGEGTGGEFQIATLTGDVSALAVQAPGLRAGGSFFQTFCMQIYEAIFPGTPYTWTLDTKFNGVNPLLPSTAYLYQKFFDGSLAGAPYQYGAGRTVSAKSLQLALWKLQGEILPATSFETAYNLDGQAQAWVAQANGSGALTIGNVRVLVITDASGNPVQDLLAIVPSGGPPGLLITKSASSIEVAPFATVTYTYTVSNTGSVDLNNVVVKDKSDQGTPADPSDDLEFTVCTIPLLPAGSSQTFTFELILPVKFCATINGSMIPAGTMTTEVLPGDKLKATYVQSEGVNDNRYGTGATPATGWPGSNHSFKSLVGSDKMEFRFKNKANTTVLDFYMDYISQAASATFAAGIVNYPSGYGTLGPHGGDGDPVSGDLSNLCLVQTSFSENLNNPTFQTGYFVNSPPETAPLSGISIPAGWNYKNSYTAIVKGSVFGPNGTDDFGCVVVPDQHNSPPKVGSNQMMPEPCDSEVCNIATGTATAGGIPVTASSAKVCVKIKTGAGGGGGPAMVVRKSVSFSGRKMYVELTNNGGSPAVVAGIKIGWPNGASDNKKLKKIATSKTIWDTQASVSPQTITTFKDQPAVRTIAAGATVKFTFEFEANAKTDLTKYDFSVDFGGGYQMFIP